MCPLAFTKYKYTHARLTKLSLNIPYIWVLLGVKSEHNRLHTIRGHTIWSTKQLIFQYYGEGCIRFGTAEFSTFNCFYLLSLNFGSNNDKTKLKLCILSYTYVYTHTFLIFIVISANVQIKKKKIFIVVLNLKRQLKIWFGF